MELQFTFATLVMVVASGIAWRAGSAAAQPLRWLRTPLFAILVVLTSLYASSWVGRFENLHVFRIGPAVLISNLTLVFVCFLAGFAWEIPGVRSTRGALALGTLVVLGGVFFFAPLLRPLLMPVQLAAQGRWIDGVCLQTDDASCGPAAAATLLSQHGVDVDEREMAKYCLTSRAGTEPLALYQGLVSRSGAAGLSTRVASRDPDDWARHGQFPLLAMVSPPELQFGTSRVVRLQQLLGRSSDGHAVVILGVADNGDYEIADPASGRVTWSRATVHRFYSGQAIYLE